MLKQDLKSSYPPYETFKTIPALKKHLVEAWERQKEKSATAKEGGKNGESGKDGTNKKRESSASAEGEGSSNKSKVPKLEKA